MAEGLAESQWAQTSSLLAAIWSGNGNMKKPRLFKPDEFNPFRKARRSGTRITAANIHELSDAFVGKGRQATTKPPSK